MESYRTPKWSSEECSEPQCHGTHQQVQKPSAAPLLIGYDVGGSKDSDEVADVRVPDLDLTIDVPSPEQVALDLVPLARMLRSGLNATAKSHVMLERVLIQILRSTAVQPYLPLKMALPCNNLRISTMWWSSCSAR